jgi:RNA polymerase sigma-70 factor (ECF subfamily)
MRDGPEARLALVDAILTRGDLADYHLAPRRGPTCVGWWGNRPMPGPAAHGPSPWPNRDRNVGFLERRLAQLTG